MSQGGKGGVIIPAGFEATIPLACSELAQFPADLEGLTGMLLVEQKDPSGHQHQSEHGDGRPGAERPSHGYGPADRCCATPPGRLVVVPVHRWRRRARLTFHSGGEARIRGAGGCNGGCSALAQRPRTAVLAEAKANASRTPESCRCDATGDREAVQLRVLNQRGERVALAFPIVRSAVSFQP